MVPVFEGQKKVGETAQSIELRQSGENSILGNIAINVSASVTQILWWAFWWNSTEESPDDVTNEQEIQSTVAAWQANAIGRDAMTDFFQARGSPAGGENERGGSEVDPGGREGNPRYRGFTLRPAALARAA